MLTAAVPGGYGGGDGGGGKRGGEGGGGVEGGGGEGDGDDGSGGGAGQVETGPETPSVRVVGQKQTVPPPDKTFGPWVGSREREITTEVTKARQPVGQWELMSVSAHRASCVPTDGAR